MRPALWKIYRDFGWEGLKDMLVTTPLSFVHQGGLELLALTGVEEFGAPPEGQES